MLNENKSDWFYSVAFIFGVASYAYYRQTALYIPQRIFSIPAILYPTFDQLKLHPLQGALQFLGGIQVVRLLFLL